MQQGAILTAAILLGSIGNVSASDDIHWRGPGMQVVLHHGDQAVSLQAGDNRLDRPKVIDCYADECLISFTARAFFVNTGVVNLCGFVDGVSASPPCFSDAASSGWKNLLQSAKVLHGQHTIQTVVHSNDPTGSVLGWEVDYTIYEK